MWWARVRRRAGVAWRGVAKCGKDLAARGTGVACHVLDDAPDRETGALEKVDGPLDGVCGDAAGGGDEEDAAGRAGCGGEVARQGQVLCGCPGRRVDHQDVDGAPLGAVQELLDHGGLAWTAPDDGCVPGGKHHADAERDQGARPWGRHGHGDEARAALRDPRVLEP